MSNSDLRLDRPEEHPLDDQALGLGAGSRHSGQLASPETGPPSRGVLSSQLDLTSYGQTRLAQLRLPALPQTTSKRSNWGLLSFVIMVMVPFALAASYYAFIAADQYLVEFRFSVTEVNPILPSLGSSGSSASSGSSSSNALSSAISSLTSGGISVSNSAIQNYMVVDFLKSRQAVDALQKALNIRDMYSVSHAKSDWLAAFDPKLPTEDLVDYWNSMITAFYDPVTGLATARVRAFDPDSALAVGRFLVTLAEEQVNSIEKRAQTDAIRSAEAEARSAQERLGAATSALAEFRLQEGVIDPTASVGTNADLRKTLAASVSQLQTDLAALVRQNVSQSSPTVMTLKSQIAATQEQLRKIEAEVSKSPEERRDLADMVGRYEKLDMDRQYAMSMAIATRQALDQARANANAQHVFLTPYVLPAIPTVATYPQKYRWLFGIFMVLLLAWTVTVLAARSINEHLNLR